MDGYYSHPLSMNYSCFCCFDTGTYLLSSVNTGESAMPFLGFHLIIVEVFECLNDPSCLGLFCPY